MAYQLSEKYRPRTLDEMVLDGDTRENIRAFIKKGTVFNMLLCGSPGIGKSTLARVISNELGSGGTTLYINCGYDNGVDVMKTRVKEFCDSNGMDGSMKIVILDEADSLTSNTGSNSDAQKSLRNIIEESNVDTRFILTCNSENRVIEALQSRCQPVKIFFTHKDVVHRLAKIIEQEKIKCDKETLKLFIAEVVGPNFPDIRTMIGLLETWSVKGVLEKPAAAADRTPVARMVMDKKDPREIRKLLINTQEQFGGDYVRLAQDMFNLAETFEQQLVIAEHLFRMAVVADVEIEFSAMVVELKTLKEKR